MTYALSIFTADQIKATRVDLVALLQDAVNGGASVNFVAPLSPEVAATFWERVEREVANDERVVVVAQVDGMVVGCAHLVLATQPNGRHRAEVQKMLVHSQQRRLGIGRALLTAAEDAARERGRTLLVLDTERDSAGEKLYAAQGWQRAGIIPAFALNHDGTRLIDTILFYKLL
jgi:GNAT superfamily N-acetyltransferase